ncbi:MAG: hypothetical protein N2515_04805, partial [Deltaproteobacteria bacterium]|nr:hypothetical protein [Deltaproteobacteria bacterium]
MKTRAGFVTGNWLYLVPAVFWLACDTEHAFAQLTPLFSGTLRGGIAVDGWAGVSSPTFETTGVFRIQLPRGARVRQAFYGVVALTPIPIPPGPAGHPRRVTLGRAPHLFVRTVEGMPDRLPTGAGAFTWALFQNDVTEVVRGIVGDSAPG